MKTLIEAAKLCGCRLVIVGTGPQEEELKACAEGFSNIEFEGFQTGETLRTFIRNSRCVVMPSVCYENGPYSAMEAMALGKPLIVSNLGGLPELVEDGVNGYIFDGTTQDLKEKICSLQALPEDAYGRMAQCSLNKAKTMFSPDVYVKGLEAHYERSKGGERA